MYYYWNQMGQQQYPTGQYPTYQNSQFAGQQMMPPATGGGNMQITAMPGRNITAPNLREESYIENILRLNRGKPGTFYFTVPSATGIDQQGNTKRVRGVVVEAGRDHAIIRELQTNHYFLFPMIYFDYAEFDEELAYFAQTPGLPG
ncbi:spore coat protein GerQ [Lysinibacillus sp. BW-2-10]|nr:spore coat protein GerQ [Lysinibacillus sp. BW-2-10]